MKTRKKNKLANKIPKKGGVVVKKADKADKRRRKPGNPKGKGGFQKGRSGNPLGRPKETPEIKELRNNYRNKFLTTFDWLASLQPEELKKVQKKKLTLMEGGMLQALKNHYKTGNYEWVRFPNEYIMGKAVQAIDIEGTSGGNINFVIGQDYLPIIGNGDSTDSKS